MGRIVVTEHVSLDGVMEGPVPGTVGDFKHKGWLLEFNSGEDGDRFKLDETLRTEALLLGRVTYGEFAAFWPSMSGPLAEKLNGMPTYVISSTLTQAEWNNATVLRGDIREEVAKLRHELNGDIVVHGSRRLAQALIDHDLVDELHLMVFPVLLGAGERLLGDTSGKKTVRLVDSKTVGNGVAILIYRPAS
jgi:dihydrofolate reductase